MDQQKEFDLMRYALAIWRRKWIVVGIAIVALTAAFVATRLGAGAGDDTENVVVADVYRATITIQIESESALPSNPALALIGVGGAGGRGLETHVQLMRSRNVLERAAEKLRSDPESGEDVVSVVPTQSDAEQLDEPAEPLSISEELELEIDVLESDVTVRALADTDLIEVVARASDPLVAQRRAQAMIDAYLDFLVDDEFGSIRDSLEAVTAKIEEIELSTIVTPEVLTLFTILSNDLDGIGRAVDSGAEELLKLESDISVAVQESIGETDGTIADSSSVASADRGLEILKATADSISFASKEIDLVFEKLSKAEFDAVLSAQVNTLVDAAISLDTVSVQILALYNEISQVDAGEVLTGDIGQFETANTELDSAVNQLGQVDSIGTLGSSIIPLQQEVAFVVARLETMIETASASTDIESIRPLIVDEARAAGSSLTVIANELVELRRRKEVSALDQGYMLAAEARLRTAAGALETVTDSSGQSSVTLAGALLWQIGQQLSALAEASDTVVSDVKTSSDLGTAGPAERDLLAQHILATSSTLHGVNAVIRNVRNGQVDGMIFAQLVSAEAQINAVTDSLSNSGPTINTLDSGTVTEQLDALRKQLIGASTITDQLLTRSTIAIDAGDRGEETQRLMANQIEAGAGVLLVAADELESVRELDVPGTNAGGLISLEARLRGLSDGLFALEQISSARDRLASISVTAANAGLLIAAVDGDTELDDARDAVGEIGVHLMVASAAMAEASLEVQELADREALSGDSNLALVAQRVQSAGTRLATLTGRLPQIEGGSTADSESLLTLRGELEILLLRPQETSFTTIGESVNLVGNPTAFLALGGDGMDLTFLLGGVAGLLLGIIAAIGLEAVDRSIKGPNDVKPIKGLVPLGVVARGAAKGNPHPPEVIDQPGSIFSESVQLLMNSVEKCLGDKTKTIVVTSPRAREGKTMLALNLARTFGLRGKNVLLVDANLRKPDSSKILEVLENDGLANVLAGEASVQDLVVHAEGLDVLPAGNSVIMPVELLSRSEMGALLRQFEQRYDFVIIDAPPVLGFSDTTALAKQAGAAVLVVRAGKSKRDDIEEASEMFDTADVKLVGAVVNFVKPKTLKHLAHEKYNRSKSGSKWLGRVPFGIGGKFPFSRN